MKRKHHKCKMKICGWEKKGLCHCDRMIAIGTNLKCVNYEAGKIQKPKRKKVSKAKKDRYSNADLSRVLISDRGPGSMTRTDCRSRRF